MMVKDIMDKYRISDEEFLHLRAMYNGTTMHSSREHISVRGVLRGPPSGMRFRGILKLHSVGKTFLNCEKTIRLQNQKSSKYHNHC